MALFGQRVKGKVSGSFGQQFRRMFSGTSDVKGIEVQRPKEEIVDVSLELKRRKELIIDSNIPNTKALPCVSYELDQKVEQRLAAAGVFPEVDVVLDPYKKAPLCALALFHTEKPLLAKFVVYGDTEEDTVSGNISEAKTSHRLPIFGLYPNRENTVMIQLYDESGKAVEETKVTIRTGKLPKSLEGAAKVEKHSAKSAYNLILVSGKSAPYPFAFDSSGCIRYYLNYRPKGYGLLPLSNERYIFVERKVLCPTYQLPHSTQIYEIDALGRIYKVFYVPRGCHHDVCEKEPGGNLLAITNSIEGHIGDVIIELDRNTGEIVDRVDLRQIFGNTHRDNINWTHLNTVSYNKEEDTVLFCARNLHSVCKIRWSTKELLWILCDPRFWENTPFEGKLLKPVGEMKWSYQAHAPYVFEKCEEKPNEVRLAIFDNHHQARRKVSFFDGDNHSYIKIYRINEKDHTVTMEHSYQGVKSKITSNPRVEREKDRVFSMGAYLDPLFEESRGGMIYEFDYDTEEVLNQYSIKYYYYRGYEFSPDYGILAGKMKLDSNYMAGFLIKPERFDGMVEIPEDKLADVEFDNREEVTIARTDEVIYIGTKDHLLGQVYFVGKKNTYYRDIRKPEQTDPRFVNIVFSVAFPVHMMEPDDYRIVIDFKGKLYDTERNIRIGG